MRICGPQIFSTEGCPRDLDLRPEVDKRVTASEEVVIGFTGVAGKGSVQKAL